MVAAAADWAPTGWRRAWIGALDLIAPKRAQLARHFARYETDATYRASWDVLFERGHGGYRDAQRAPDKTPSRVFGWSRSADAEILGDLKNLRAFCREAARDDPVASGVLRAYMQGVVGTGVNDQSSALERDKQTAINAVWRSLRDSLFPAERLSWAGGQRLLARRKLEDGEAFVVRYWPQSGDPVQFDLVEADRVDTPLDAEPEDPEGEIREGVERDRDGRIVAYWVAKKHPGDTALRTVIRGKRQVVRPLVKAEFTRVRAEDAFHLRNEHLRPGQTRSVPILHAVVQDLRDLDLLVEAVLKRVQVAACFAAFIKSPEDVKQFATATGKKYGLRLKQDLVPGMLYKLFPGEEIQTLNPNFPMPDLDVFVRLIARRVGTALGVSWQIVLSDFSEANYSSARADDRRAEKSYAIARQDLVECLTWIRRTVLEDALLRRELVLVRAGVTAEDLDATWIAPQRNVLLDPEKENKADVIALEGGLDSQKDVHARRGKDWEEVMRQRLLEEKREQELRAELGLPQAPSPTEASADLRSRLRAQLATTTEAA